MKFRTLPVFLAFLVMGFGDAIGPFVGLAKGEFNLSRTIAFLIPLAGFIMFGILSIPMGLLQDKKGKKFILLLGLSIAFLGLILPMFGLHHFGMFLLTILLLGAGAATLQVAGNPFMRDVSDEGKYSRNLSLAQFVKAIGSLSGPLIPVLALRWFGIDWKVIFPIYSICIAVTILATGLLRVQEKKVEGSAPATLGSCLSLLRDGYVLVMVLAIFFYVGAEVSVSSGIPLYLHERFGVDVTKVGLLGTGLFFLALIIGRFSGGLILNWLAPKKFLIITCILSLIGLLGMFIPSEKISIIGFFLIGFGFANIFPLVFSIAVDTLPQHTNKLSGLMVTAIVGGAIIPPIMGYVAETTKSMQMGFIVPLAALVYITIVAFSSTKVVMAKS